MAVEGVLTDSPQPDNILNAEVSQSGRVLFMMLRDTTRLLLLTNDPNRDRVVAWLAREHLSRYADIHSYTDPSLTAEQWRIQHIKDLIGVGHHISFYIDSDPAVVKEALEAGVDALLVAQSGNTPGKRPEDMAYSPWYDLVDSIERESLIRATRSQEILNDATQEAPRAGLGRDS